MTKPIRQPGVEKESFNDWLIVFAFSVVRMYILELVPIVHSNRATVNLFISRANSLDHPSPSWISCISLPVEKMNWRRMHSGYSHVFVVKSSHTHPGSLKLGSTLVLKSEISCGEKLWKWAAGHIHSTSTLALRSLVKFLGFTKNKHDFHRISPTVQCLRGSRKALHVYPPAMHFGVSTILYLDVFKAWKQTG